MGIQGYASLFPNSYQIMLYIFHGPDDYTRDEKIAELRAAIGDPAATELNVTLLEGADIRLGDIRHHADAMPFLTDKRLVIVAGYLSGLGHKSDLLEPLIDYVGHLPPTTDLILVETEALSARHPLLKAAANLEATVVMFDDPNRSNLAAWIIKKTAEHQAEIEPSAAELLGKVVGPNLRTLNSEIEKLALYVGGQRAIQSIDIDVLVPYHEEAENFGLANAIGQRNAGKAYDQLHKLLDEDKHPMAILGSIAAQIRGLIEVKDMAERGMSPAEIARLKGWGSDYPAKMRLREAARFSASRLENILEMLLQIDLDIKTGRVDSQLALDTLIARLCTF
jgi:DNA polymerase-3 subunit delta